MAVRRVVSGQDGHGKSIIVSDERVEGVALGQGTTIVPLWGGDQPPSFPLSGAPPGFETFFPGPGGYRFMIMTIPPDANPGTEAADEAGMARLGTGLQDWMETETPGMHTTDTIDFEVVLSGEASMEFDDGITTHLQAGDCFVQNGTRHRWYNRGTVDAVVAAIIVGGHPRRQ